MAEKTMVDKIKNLLKALYPDADPDKGIDFNKSHTIEEGEKIRDFDNNGQIDDVDYALLTFNNRPYFIDTHGGKKWKDLERYWNEAAKKGPMLFAKEPSMGNTKDPKVDAIQGRVASSLYPGRENKLTIDEAKEVAKKQSALLELQGKYPNLDIEKIAGEDIETISKDLEIIEKFSPNMARRLRYIKRDFSLDGCAGDGNDNIALKLLRGAFEAGCASNGGININPIQSMLANNEDIIHETSHVYYKEIITRDSAKIKDAKNILLGYADSKGYCEHAGRKHEKPRFSESRGYPLIEDTLRDNIEKNIDLQKNGHPYDKKLINLYNNYLKSLHGSFAYEWNHANDNIARDIKFEEVEKAGQMYDNESTKLEGLFIKEFGENCKNPFWKDPFYYGGDRSELILKGHIQDKVYSLNPSSTKRKRLEKAMHEWKQSKTNYTNKVRERFSSKIVRVGIGEGEIVLFNSGTRTYGMPTLYSFTNDYEAVGEVVRSSYVDKRDDRQYPLLLPDQKEDEQMRQNYISVLRKYGFF